MTQPEPTVFSGEILEENIYLTLDELSRVCAVERERIIELVEEGVIVATTTSSVEWRFPGDSLRRARVALRLQQDLGVNAAGAALAMELMEEIVALRRGHR